MKPKSAYRMALLTALGQLNALLSAGDPVTDDDRKAITDTLYMLEESIKAAKRELT